jgi:hypothetical protein
MVKAVIARKLKERPVMAPQVMVSALEGIADRLVHEAIFGREPVEAARLLFENAVGRPKQQNDMLETENPYDSLTDEELKALKFKVLRGEAVEVEVKEVPRIEEGRKCEFDPFD